MCITNVTRLWLHIFRESCGHAHTQRGGIDEACLQKIAAVYVMYSTHLDSRVIATTCQGTCKNAWRTALASHCMHTQFWIQGKTFQYTLDTHTPTRSWQSLRNDSCVGYCGAWGLPQHKTGWAERQAHHRDTFNHQRAWLTCMHIFHELKVLIAYAVNGTSAASCESPDTTW